MRDVIAAIAKVERVAGDRVDGVRIGRAASVKLNGKWFVAMIDVSTETCERRGVQQAQICRTQRVTSAARAVGNRLVGTASPR